jgi:hypothetical protein
MIALVYMRSQRLHDLLRDIIAQMISVMIFPIDDVIACTFDGERFM